MQIITEATPAVDSESFLPAQSKIDVVNDDLLPVPSILPNSKITDRYTYLHERFNVVKIAPSVTRRLSRHDNDGKRWLRRKKNDHFVGNPHIVLPTKNDCSPPIPRIHSTFPEPLPAYLPRNSLLPSNSNTSSSSDDRSAMSGIFSLGLKGVRRELRRSGVRAQNLVREIEDQILDWLLGGTILLSDNDKDLVQVNAPEKLIGQTGTILEVFRNPLQLVWYIESDGFARYIIHCCARYHAVVSYSKEDSGRRLTYLLRPNVLRPDRTVLKTLDTPPPTDVDTSVYGLDTDLDSLSVSELDVISEVALTDEYEHPSRPLSSVSERSDMSNQADNSITLDNFTSVDNSSAHFSGFEDTDGDGDESELGFDLSESIDSLSLNMISRLSRDTSVRSRGYISDDRQVYRSPSSPTAFSSKRSQFKSGTSNQSTNIEQSRIKCRSFYDYLFA